MTPWAAKWIACCDDPHCRSTDVAGDRVRETGRDPGVAGDVAALLADLGDAAADDVVDPLGVDAGALDERRQGVAEEVGRVPAGERALALADRRADGVDDDRFTGCHVGRGYLTPMSGFASSSTEMAVVVRPMRR